MSIVIGIDVGISTTKIVGIDEQGIVMSPFRIKATDPITSLYGAFGKYLHDNKIKLEEVEQIMLTGVGAAYIDENIYGRSTGKAQEFIADGLGARYESNLDRMIVVSMGTGTSLVKCDGSDIRHIGGIGIGGGTLQGLSRIMLKTDDIRQVATLAMDGDISKINLLIGDISAKPLPGLPMTAKPMPRARISPSDSFIWCFRLWGLQLSSAVWKAESKTLSSLGTSPCCPNARRFIPLWRNFTAYISAFRSTASSVQPSEQPFPIFKNDRKRSTFPFIKQDNDKEIHSLPTLTCNFIPITFSPTQTRSEGRLAYNYRRT